MKQKVDWLVLIEADDNYCEKCGKTARKYIKNYCNAVTFGMYNYGHQEFQLVLRMSNQMIMYTLNTLGKMVQDGRRFQNGDVIDDLFDGYSARLVEFEEKGRKVLRVIIPDANHKFPNEEGCLVEYSYQALPIEDLYNKNYIERKTN